MYYRGTIVKGPRTPRFQKDANPLGLCWIASVEGVRPLNMASFLWVQRDQSVAKIVCHSTSRRNVLPPRDCQKASSEITTRQPMPVAWHTNWAKGRRRIGAGNPPLPLRTMGKPGPCAAAGTSSSGTVVAGANQTP